MLKAKYDNCKTGDTLRLVVVLGEYNRDLGTVSINNQDGDEIGQMFASDFESCDAVLINQ